MRGIRPTAPAALPAAVLAAAMLVVPPALAAQDAPEPSSPDATENAPLPDALPTPLLLVPGWNDESHHLAGLRARLIEEGWPPGRVVGVEFEDPVGSNTAHADQIAAAVRALLETTGAPAVDIVAHSMGGLATRRYLQERASGPSSGTGSPEASDVPPVRRVVFLATPHRGTLAAYVAWGDGGDEMQPGSPFLDSLNAGPFVPEPVKALSLWTPMDLRVVPGESALLPESDDVRNVEVCCPTHSGMLEHDETFRRVVEFLREEPR